MQPELSRRSFLKLVSLLPLAGALSKTSPLLLDAEQNLNILVIVFDAWSGHHVPFLGYQRNTTPQLSERIEKGAIIYHNHYAAGNSTTPGTASLLSGTLPWTHRAFKHDAPISSLQHQNIFNAFGPETFIQTYTHNNVAYRILLAYREYIDSLIPMQQLSLTNDWVENVFRNDYDMASVSAKVILRHQINHNSLFLRDIFTNLFEKNRLKITQDLADQFPDDPPTVSGQHFTLETAVDWLAKNIPLQPQPYLRYFHFLPPHAPYRHTRAEFSGKFKRIPHIVPEKEENLFSLGDSIDKINGDRRAYDEFILYVDAEFDRLMVEMEKQGLLENTLVVLTSDHGELFERGIVGHTTTAMFDPLLRVPLVIFGPGITDRVDVYDKTSCLDLLPTLTQIAGRLTPDWCEGEILPVFRTTPTDPQRTIYSVNAKANEKLKPITKASISMLKGDYRLSAYLGYPELGGKNRYELYNLAEDPHELEDLYTPANTIAAQMIEELNDKLAEVDQPFS